MSRLLTLQDGPNNFTFAGNAFKITGAAIDIDDLKKVLRNFINFVSEQVSDGPKIERPCLQHVP